MKFYSLDAILSKHAIYNVIFGERSNGKTYAVLKYALKQFFINGGQVAIVRRFREDVIGRRASDIWSAINANEEVLKASNGDYEGVCYYAGKFYVCNYDLKTGKPIYNDDDCIGYTFALSETEHNKSISFPNITTIFFDEFLTNKMYFQDEFVMFMNTISTIVRNRTNVKIFMCGNTVNKFCPYFKEMGLKHIEKMKQGSIDLYQYGESKLTVAVEYCATLKKQKKNNYYFAFDNPKLKMITSGAWELDLYPHLPVKYKPKDVLYTFFIVFEGTFQCEIINFLDGIFIYIHRKTTPLKLKKWDIIYTLDANPSMNYNENILKPMNIVQRKILALVKARKIFYQDNEVGNSIENYFKICARG